MTSHVLGGLAGSRWMLLHMQQQVADESCDRHLGSISKHPKIWLHQRMQTYFMNHPVKFRPSLIWKDAASGFFEKCWPNKKNNTSSDMGSVPGPKVTMTTNNKQETFLVSLTTVLSLALEICPHSLFSLLLLCLSTTTMINNAYVRTNTLSTHCIKADCEDNIKTVFVCTWLEHL